jgi:hypothetical protein
MINFCHVRSQDPNAVGGTCVSQQHLVVPNGLCSYYGACIHIRFIARLVRQEAKTLIKRK